MASEKRPRRVPAVITDTRRNPGFALGAFGLSAWAYIGMSHTIADYEGPELGYALGVAYEALVIGLAWEGRRRADRALETGRPVSGHGRWLGGAIVVGILSGALAAWHGWLLGEGVFAISRAVAPVLAAVAVHLFFQSASSARALDRKAEIHNDRQTAVLDMLDAVRLAQIAPPEERSARIADVNTAVGRVHRHVPADVTAEVTRPHLESERTIRDVVQEAAALAGEWMPTGKAPEPASLVPDPVTPESLLLEAAEQAAPKQIAADTRPAADRSAENTPAEAVLVEAERAEAERLETERAEAERAEAERAEAERAEASRVAAAAAEAAAVEAAAAAEAAAVEAAPAAASSTGAVRTEATEPAAGPIVAERVRLEAKYAPVPPEPARTGQPAEEPVADPERPLTTAQISEIRVLRWAQTLTVEEVAARVGVSVASVKRYAPSTDPTTETGSLLAVSATAS